MIKANDLRIGNYILHDGNPYKVVGLNDAEVSFFNEKDKCRWTVTSNKVEPIELTAELLGKIKECEKYGTLYRLRLDGNGRLISLFRDGDANTVNLIRQYSDKASDWFVPDMEYKYLHQLQNLYYALTGTELSITL